MIFLLIILFTGIIALEVPGLIKKKMWRELAAFSVFMLLGMALSFSQVLGIAVPNLNRPIEIIFKPFSNWMMSK